MVDSVQTVLAQGELWTDNTLTIFFNKHFEASSKIIEHLIYGGNHMKAQQYQQFGYVRVSTKEQNLDRQLFALREYGVSDAQIYQEKQSGKDFERPVYRRLIKKLKPGDTLVIKSIDRLGRNYDEILEQWRVITKERKANIVVLDMPLLDTRQGRDLTGTLIADLVLQLLSYVAQTEREYIRRRQAEGIAAAKARGVQFGRKAMSRPDDYISIRNTWMEGKISARGAAKELNAAPKTFLKWTREDFATQSTKL